MAEWMRWEKLDGDISQDHLVHAIRKGAMTACGLTARGDPSPMYPSGVFVGTCNRCLIVKAWLDQGHGGG
jgi:hypothetical protein